MVQRDHTRTEANAEGLLAKRPAADAGLEEVRDWRRQLIRRVLLALVVLGGLAVAGAAYNAYAQQVLWQIPVLLGPYALLLIVTLWRRVPYSVQAAVLLFLTYGLGVFSLFIHAQLGDGFVVLLTVPVLAALFFGRRVGTGTLVVATATLAVFGWAFISGALVISPELTPRADDLGAWLSRILVFVMLALLLLLPMSFLVQRLVAALTRSRELAEELEAQRAGLEVAVVARTADLARRSTQLDTAAQVARDATAIHDVQQLLEETAHLVSERFGFYHTGLFLLEEAGGADRAGAPGQATNGQYAVLRAASSEGGRRMLARGHRLKVGEQGIVGYVTALGEPHVALDVGADAVFFDNPDLPDTRSEMALPLRVRGEIIGALDVQSDKGAAFSDEDVTVLQTLADQVAVAISNARLFQQVQESLEAERRAYGELSLRAWQELIHTKPGLRQWYDPQGVLSADGELREQMKRALQEGRPIAGRDGSAASLAVPLKVRDQVIGVLDAYKPAGTVSWTEEEQALLQTLADQLADALESARQYEDTQRRAAQDRVVSEITSRVRETLDVDTVLQTAVREMGRALGIPNIEVRLGQGTSGLSGPVRTLEVSATDR